ncbi:HlyD family secretion protein [Oscillatoria sp. FACHB-1407]|uniref:HlyD family secretion protein n=1 Tax=Oscillatoria sp. FACHB-1407 TaxID=2692847 RepID=UPI001681FB0F|nr:efflux RND transporter periplasmic adaptor subunit [Oscillatoria sp. FACHB-1407]MBD2461103.1 HlyD family secretion protein [Oscillatoria sp. FACHB-1407]
MAQSVSDASTQAGQAAQHRGAAKRRLLLPLGLVVVAAGLTTWYWLSRPTSDDLQLSGRIEGYETDIGSKVAGRIEEVTVREGEEVNQGDILVRMDDDELQAQLQGATAALQAAQQREANARLQVSVLESQIAEAQLTLQQSRGDTQGQISQAEATVAAAIAQLREAEAQATRANADLRLAGINRDRYAQLVNEGAVTQQQFDQAETTYQTAQATLVSQQAAVEAARRQVAAAQGGLTQTRSTNLNPDIRNVQVERLNTQLEQARVQLAIAQSDVTNAQASRQQIQAQLDNLTVVSPIDGVVTTRSVEPGVVVASGRNLLSVVDLNTVYLRGFVPAGEIGNIRVGQAARVYLDSNPDQPLAAQVAAIDAEASFTPENVYFQEDRVQQVFGVRLSIAEPGGFAKPGMPADAEIVLEESEE